MLALAGCLVAGCGNDSGSGASREGEPEEVRLDELTPEEARRAREKPRSGGKPQVVQALPPGGVAQAEEGSEDEPPERILRENAAMRKEVGHLKAIEREQRRVRKALAAGGYSTGPLQLGPGGLAWPVNGSVTSPFGQRWGRLHAGVDIAARSGTAIGAAADGLVVLAGPTGGYGNYVCVQHTRRLSTCYAHLSRLGTRKGRRVSQGQPIGLVGCTGTCFGDHLHFETRVDGQPVDPRRYF